MSEQVLGSINQIPHERRERRSIIMGLKDTFKRFAGFGGNDDDNYEESDTGYSDDVPSAISFDDFEPQKPTIKSSKIMSIPATTRLQVIVVKPEKYSDAAAIADHFKNKKTVVLNLDNTNKEVASRLIDFLGGVAYAADGDLKRIANTTYIIVPVNVDISGDMIEELGSSNDFM